MNQSLGNTDTVKKIITWSSQFSENFLEVGVIFLSEAGDKADDNCSTTRNYRTTGTVTQVIDIPI